MSRSIWQVLGIKAGSDAAAIRRAYARKLRDTNPEDDPEGFMELREAYEAALARSRWDGDAGDVPPPEPVELCIETAAPDARTAIWGEAETPEAAAQRQWQAEADDLAARQEALWQALQGKGDVRAAFDAILRAPALETVAGRDEIEMWLAETIAMNPPEADGLVDPAIAAFGWDRNQSFHNAPPAVADALRRQEELRFAEAAMRPHGNLHVGWQSLTRAPGPGWAMRLRAIAPGVPREVAQILGLAAGPLPGLALWFDAAARAWWGGYFSRPRLTAAMLLLVPLTFLLLGWLVAPWTVANELTAAAVAGLALASPLLMLRLVLIPQHRFAEAPWEAPLWRREGWMFGLAALPLLALVVPDTLPGSLYLAAVALGVAGLAIIANPPPSVTMTVWQRIGAGLTSGWPLIMVGLTVLEPLSEARSRAWLVLALAMVFIWGRGRDSLVAAVARVLPRWGLPVLLLLVLAMVGIAFAVSGGLAAGERLYLMAVVAAAATPLLLLANRMEMDGPIKLALVLGWLAVLGGAIAVVPVPTETQADRFVPPRCPADMRTLFPASPLRCGTGSWIGPDDYPPAAARAGITGRTEIGLEVDSRGRVTACAVIASSTSPLLDDQSCALARQRLRFLPARDPTGIAVPGEVRTTVGWRLEP